MSKIITIDDFRTYSTGITLDDGLAQQVVDGVNAYIEQRTGRCFGEVKTVTERFRPSGRIWLRHTDVIAITSATLGWPGQTSSTIDTTGYYFDPLGRVTFYNTLGFATLGYDRYYDYLGVTYSYGYNSLGYDENRNPVVPDDLKLAAAAIAGGAYQWASNGNRSVSEVSIGSYRVSYSQRRTGGSSSEDEAMSSGDINWSIVDSYKLRRL